MSTEKILKLQESISMTDLINEKMDQIIDLTARETFKLCLSYFMGSSNQNTDQEYTKFLLWLKENKNQKEKEKNV